MTIPRRLLLLAILTLMTGVAWGANNLPLGASALVLSGGGIKGGYISYSPPYATLSWTAPSGSPDQYLLTFTRTDIAGNYKRFYVSGGSTSYTFLTTDFCTTEGMSYNITLRAIKSSPYAESDDADENISFTCADAAASITQPEAATTSSTSSSTVSSTVPATTTTTSISLDDCGCQGTYKMCYTGDYSGDTDKACYNSGAANKDGTATGATITVAASGVTFTGADNFLEWTVSSQDLFSSAEGTLYFTVKVTDGNSNSDVDGNNWIEIRGDNNNELYIRVNDTGDLTSFVWQDNGATTQTLTGAAIDAGSTYRIGYSWKTADDVHSYSVVLIGDEPDWVNSTGASLGTWATEAALLRIGEETAGLINYDSNIVSDLVIFGTYKNADMPILRGY